MPRNRNSRPLRFWDHGERGTTGPRPLLRQARHQKGKVYALQSLDNVCVKMRNYREMLAITSGFGKMFQKAGCNLPGWKHLSSHALNQVKAPEKAGGYLRRMRLKLIL